MANLTESPVWEEGVFQLEKTTPPLGGAPAFNGPNPSAGHANVQGLQLANRTAYLKQQLEAGGSATTLTTDLANNSDGTKGAGLVGFSHSNNYSQGTEGAHSKIIVSVTDLPFGATTSSSATAAFQAAYDFVPAGGEIIIPGPGPYTLGSVIGTKEVIWTVLYDINTNLSLLNLPGKVRGGFGTSEILRRNISNGVEFATLRVDRIANYNGGSPGQVCSNIRATTTVSNNNAQSFEWVGLFVVDNSGPGQNVGVYGQGNRRATSLSTPGGTFAGCFEARDFTQENNPTSGLIGAEFDIFANGTDSVGRRLAIDIVVGKGVSTGTKCEAYAGIRIGPQDGNTDNGRFRNCLLLNGEKDYAVNITGTCVENDISITSTAGKSGIRVGGSHTEADLVSEGISPIGMRFNGTYSSGLAVRIPANTGYGMESTGAIKMNYSSSLGTVQILNGPVLKTSFDTTTGALLVTGTKVVGSRDTGWAAMTGTGNKGTVYDVSSVTLPQLAARVAQLQATLTTHGLIGV